MIRKYRLSLHKSSLYDKYFPLISFLNDIPNSYFIKTIEGFIQGIGISYNEVHSEFPEDLDPDEESFEGIRFAVLESEVVTDYSTLYWFLALACKAYVEDYPEEDTKISFLLNKFCEKYNVNKEFNLL